MIIPDSCEKRQRVNSPTVFINGSHLIFIQIDVFFCIVIDEKFVVKREVGGRNADWFCFIAPNSAVAGNIEGRAVVEAEIFRIITIIAAPNDAARFVVEKFGERIDERVFPPTVFHKLCEGIFAVDRAVEYFAIQAEFIAQNRTKILPQNNHLLFLRNLSSLGN